MNSGLTRLALFTRDLLSYDEQLIRIGRENFIREDFTSGFIVIDALGPTIRLASGNKYNGDTELQSLNDLYQAPCTVNFYGSGAYARATEFTLRIRSQEAYDLQVEHLVTVNRVSTLTDVKALTGQQYGENIELNLTIQYNQSIDLAVLRIDEAQIEIISETGQELAP